jgi:hypothetical protein
LLEECLGIARELGMHALEERTLAMLDHRASAISPTYPLP